jgi:hypothetical protein
MIIHRMSSDEWHKRNSAQVEKWRKAWAKRREQLRPQWERECQWHRHFVWFPVDVGYDKSAWLMFVERRIKYRSEMPEIRASWSLREFEYRLIQLRD